jgi:hypothetical protein
MNTEIVWLFAAPDKNSPDGMSLYIVAKRHEYYPSDEHIKLAEVLVHYDPPNEFSRDKMILKAIQTLRDKQDRIIAEAQKHKMELQQKIDKLLLLDHKHD